MKYKAGMILKLTRSMLGFPVGTHLFITVSNGRYGREGALIIGDKPNVQEGWWLEDFIQLLDINAILLNKDKNYIAYGYKNKLRRS